MDERWYNQRGESDDIILVSRIRLLRNFAGYKFPDRMTEEERAALVNKLDEKLTLLDEVLGNPTQKIVVDAMKPIEKAALNERLLINKAALQTERTLTTYASRDESFSMTVNGQDHIRLLISRHGQELEDLFSKLDSIDDYIGSKIPYAFSTKFGFKTADIANVGTGMRAYFVMHLPLLSEQKNFNGLLQEISRYGVVIKPAWGSRKNPVGGLYVLYNQRTLGVQEKDIRELLISVANQLMQRERELRVQQSSFVLRDRVMRSYGILKYSVRMELSEAFRHLSNIMLGISLGMLRIDTDLSAYELMLGVQPGNLQVFFDQALDDQNMLLKRSEYLRLFMQEITPN